MCLSHSAVGGCSDDELSPVFMPPPFPRPRFLVSGKRLSLQEVDSRQIRGPDPCRRGGQISDDILCCVMIIWPRLSLLTMDKGHRKERLHGIDPGYQQTRKVHPDKARNEEKDCTLLVAQLREAPATTRRAERRGESCRFVIPKNTCPLGINASEHHMKIRCETRR